MLERYSTRQLMILYLGSKALIEDKTQFDLTRTDKDPMLVLHEALNQHARHKPAIYNHLSRLSLALKKRNFTDFHGWYDFSCWENFHHFVIKTYQNNLIKHSFSLN